MILEQLTLIARTAAVLLVLALCVRLFRARKSDGELLAAFTWYFLANAVTMLWYIAATVLGALGYPALRPYLWGWAWVLWVVMFVTMVRLWRALHRS